MFLCGNDALCLGAIKAGCKFVGEYPMTPSSSVLHFMAAWSQKYGIVVKHVEDEIAAAISVIGAGFAGVRSLAATSGGGFALMSEAIGLASMNEVPTVFVDVMRPGPATGLPTRTGQGDLRQVIHAGQDDPIKIVLIASDMEECFRFGFEAFNLAEKYQLPVILCFDKYIGEGYFTVAPFDENGMKIERGKLLLEKDLAKNSDFKRYELTEDGVSPRSIPGQKGGVHRATSDEHNEHGEICEDADNRKKMVEKRMKKLEVALKELPPPIIIGDKDADITFVTWTSSKGACVEACEMLKEKKISANVLLIRTAYPFHKKETLEILKKLKRPILVEQNYTAQLGGLIAEHTGILIEEKILKYDGRPFTAKNIIENLK
jgi:2-oxoglutarate ferredoxin oxidoreductase subunit alpha